LPKETVFRRHFTFVLSQNNFPFSRYITINYIIAQTTCSPYPNPTKHFQNTPLTQLKHGQNQKQKQPKYYL